MLANIKKFISGAAASQGIAAALKFCRENGSEGLFFQKGEYHFHPEDAAERYCYISNNDEGLKKIIFDLEELKNFSIAGEDAQFIFHGRVIPFFVTCCCNISLSGISIDFADSFVSDAVVTAIHDNAIDVKILSKHWIENGKLRFFDDAYDRIERFFRIMRFDSCIGEFASDAHDDDFPRDATALPNGSVRLKVRPAHAKTGDVFVIKHQSRFNPGMIFDRCDKVTVKDVTCFHCGGMGLLAQCCNDLHISRFDVRASERFQRSVSASDDALHCVDCRGTVQIENCNLERQWDDGINIHGVYRKLRRRNAASLDFYFLETGHFQQGGIEVARIGDIFEFIKNDTLEHYFTAQISKLHYYNKQMTGVEFDRPLPTEFKDGDCARNLSAIPESVSILNCSIRNNTPRGILISGLGPTLIEGNYFHTPGQAIHISGDANFWYEAGPMNEVMIRGNTFDKCCYMHFAKECGAVNIEPEIQQFKKNFYYHTSIHLENNTFIHAHERQFAVRAASVAKLICSDIAGEAIYTSHCGELKL